MSSTLCSLRSPHPDSHTDLHRRLIGRRFEDETVKKDVQSWPFKVIDQGGSPMIEVSYLGETKQFSAQEISAMVLVKVRPTPRRFCWHPTNNNTDEGGC
jgi:molecular chaperone DnaK (HSP70)